MKNPPGGGELIIAGMGLRPEHMTIETGLQLKRCRRIYTSVHGAYVEEFLRTMASDVRLMPNDRAQWPGILRGIVGLLKRGQTIAYLVTGNPMLLSESAQRLSRRCRSAGIPVKVLPAVSSLDVLLCTLSPADGEWKGFEVLYGPHLGEGKLGWNTEMPVFIVDINHFCGKSPKQIRKMTAFLKRNYPPAHPVSLIEYGVGNGGDAVRVSCVARLERELRTIRDFRRLEKREYMGTLYLPPRTAARRAV